MKTKIKLLALPALALVVVLVMGITAPAKTIIASAYSSQWSPPVLVILGDSIGTGYGVSGYSAANVQNQTALYGYGKVIADATDYDVRCRAVDGATTFGVIDRLTNHEGTRVDVMAANIINITIGGNDLRYINDIMGSSNFMINTINEVKAGVSTENADAALEHLRSGITTILDLIYELNPNALVVAFENYAPPFHTVNILERAIIAAVFGMPAAMDPAGLNLAGITIVTRLNNEVWAERAANYLGAMVLSDAYNAMLHTTAQGVTRTDKGLFQFDFIHPTQSGHNILADILMGTLNQYNEDNIVVTTSAVVKQLKGNQNELTVTVVESFPHHASIVYTKTFMIDNNVEGYYEFGGYTVFVNTKGNTQIRDCFIVTTQPELENVA